MVILGKNCSEQLKQVGATSTDKLSNDNMNLGLSGVFF